MTAGAGVTAAAVPLLLLLACTPPQPPDYNRLPVLMVHGLGDRGAATFGDLIHRLERRGWPRDYLAAPDLVPSDGSNVDAGEVQLAVAAESLLARAARANRGRMPPRMIVVGHSMGALSSRWYVSRVAPERVAAWVGLAGANHGTDAFCSRGGAGPDDMCPAFAASASDSPIQVELNGTPASPRDESPFSPSPDSPGRPHVPHDTARRIHYFTVESTREGWISPAESTRLDGTGGLELPDSVAASLRPLGDGRFLVTGTDHDRLPHEAAVAALLDGLERAAR